MPPDEDAATGLIDDEGRLFGFVNVVDALVVVLVVAIGVAGLALVLSSGGATTTTTNTTHATIDMGVQPISVANSISVGDSYQPQADSDMTITDVYRVPEGNGQRTIIRVALTGPATEGSIEYAGEPPRLGRSVTVLTDRYNTTGDIRAVGESETLTTNEQTVVLQTDLSPSRASAFSADQQIRIGDRTLATVEDVVRYELGGSERTRVYLQASIETYNRDGTPYYGGTLLQEGATLQLPTKGSITSVNVVRVGTSLEVSETTALTSGTVTSDEARAISAGDAYLVGEETIATIEEVTVYDTDTPDRKTVYANVSLETISLGDRPRFGSTILTQGASIPFRTSEYELDFRIEQLGSGLERSETIVLVRHTLPGEDAREITKGDRYLVAGQTVGTVESVTRYGTGNPDRTQVYVGLRLDTLGFNELPLFGSTFIQQGATIPFRTADYELEGSVQRVGTTEQPGQPATRTATIEIKNVDPNIANSIEAGMAETSNGETIARITSVKRENATVVLTSDDGQIYQREHPINQDVTVTVDLSVRVTAAGVRFKGERLQQGSTVRLDLGGLTVVGTLQQPI